MPRSAASDLVLHYLPVSHKKGARLKWCKVVQLLFLLSPVLFSIHFISKKSFKNEIRLSNSLDPKR